MKKITGKNGVSHCWARSGPKFSISYLISIILCWGKRGCAVHCTVFTNIPSFYALDASCIFSPVVATINCVQTLPKVLCAAKSHLVENRCFKGGQKSIEYFNCFQKCLIPFWSPSPLASYPSPKRVFGYYCCLFNGLRISGNFATLFRTHFQRVFEGRLRCTTISNLRRPGIEWI